MSNYKISKFEDNTKVLAIGSLFRNIDGNQWRINLKLSSLKDRSYLTISNAPIIALKSTINVVGENSQAGWKEILTIKNTNNWEVKNINTFPKELGDLNQSEKKQKCFFFTTSEGKNIYLPQFELARALFFHNGYLSRTAIESDCLNTEFDVLVDKESNLAVIHVMPTSGYSKEYFREESKRNLLSWILLDPEARESYESITKNQKLNGKEKNGYRHWDFQFDPPSLLKTKLTVRGHFDSKSNSLFVFEIDAINNLKADLPENIEIYHPEFKTNVQGSEKGGSSSAGTECIDEPPTIDDEAEANSDTQRYFIQSEKIELTFNKAFKANKISRKKRITSFGRIDDDVSSESSSDVSTDESISGGNLPAADWDGAEDKTDNTHLFENKFTCFQNMLTQLGLNEGCTIINKQINKLPRINGRNSKHLLSTDDSPRCLVDAKIKVDDRVFHLLEVDTSDAKKSLSTQLLYLKNPGNWSENLKDIEIQLIASHLRWPTGLISTICGKSCKAIHHPKSAHQNKGVLDPKSIKGWADRIFLIMNNI